MYIRFWPTKPFGAIFPRNVLAALAWLLFNSSLLVLRWSPVSQLKITQVWKFTILGYDCTLWGWPCLQKSTLVTPTLCALFYSLWCLHSFRHRPHPRLQCCACSLVFGACIHSDTGLILGHGGLLCWWARSQGGAVWLIPFDWSQGLHCVCVCVCVGLIDPLATIKCSTTIDPQLIDPLPHHNWTTTEPQPQLNHNWLILFLATTSAQHVF